MYFSITWNCDLDWDFDKYCKPRFEHHLKKFGNILVFQNYFIENTVEIRHIQTKLSCATVRDCADAVRPGKQNVFVTFNEKKFKALSSSPEIYNTWKLIWMKHWLLAPGTASVSLKTQDGIFVTLTTTRWIGEPC